MSHEDADSPEVTSRSIWTIVVAGGSGLRFGGRKQFAELHGRSVLERSIETAASVSDGVVVVVPADVIDEHDLSAMAGDGRSGELRVVAGGETRAQSVRAGLDELPDDVAFVLVHDAARPLATPELFGAVIDALVDGAQAVVPGVPVADTIRQRDGGVLDRSGLIAVQTPQGFPVDTLRAAHASQAEATDDATLVESLGHSVVVVEGEAHNRKLTDPTDLITAAAVISHLEAHE